VYSSPALESALRHPGPSADGTTSVRASFHCFARVARALLRPFLRHQRRWRKGQGRRSKSGCIPGVGGGAQIGDIVGDGSYLDSHCCCSGLEPGYHHAYCKFCILRVTHNDGLEIEYCRLNFCQTLGAQAFDQHEAKSTSASASY
jgi:hypothetical protein